MQRIGLALVVLFFWAATIDRVTTALDKSASLAQRIGAVAQAVILATGAFIGAAGLATNLP